MVMTEREDSNNSEIGAREIPTQRNAAGPDLMQGDPVGDDGPTLERENSSNNGKETTGHFTADTSGSNFMETLSVPDRPPLAANHDQLHSNGQRSSPPPESYGEPPHTLTTTTSQGQVCRYVVGSCAVMASAPKKKKKLTTFKQLRDHSDTSMAPITYGRDDM